MESYFTQPWVTLLAKLMEHQQRLQRIQERDYSAWRARKILALKDAEYTFYDVDHEQAKASHRAAWKTFTGEIVALYVAAAHRNDGGYGAGLELVLDLQRGHGDLIDAPPLEALVKVRCPA